MTTIIVRHKVADFQIWKAGFEAHAPARKEAGITDGGVYKEGGDKDVMVVVLMEANDVGAVKAMFQSEQLAAAMKEAGVISAPEIWTGSPLL